MLNPKHCTEIAAREKIPAETRTLGLLQLGHRHDLVQGHSTLAWPHLSQHSSQTRFLASVLLVHIWENHKPFRCAEKSQGSVTNCLARCRRWRDADTASWNEHGDAESHISQVQVKRTRKSPFICGAVLKDGIMARYCEIKCSGWFRSRVDNVGDVCPYLA